MAAKRAEMMKAKKEVAKSKTPESKLLPSIQITSTDENEENEFNGGFFKIVSPCRKSTDNKIQSPKALSPSNKLTPLKRRDSNNLRRSLLTNSIIKASSQGRRESLLSSAESSPNVKKVEKSSRPSLLPGMNQMQSPANPKLLGDDLMNFESPESPPKDFRVTPRRSNRLSFSRVSYKY